MTIAVIGTGIIGAKLAEALLRAAHNVIIYNRTMDKTKGLVESGAVAVSSPRDAVSAAQGIILALSDKKAVDDVLSGIKMTWKDKAFIQMGTISPAESIALGRDIEAAGGEYMECPVLGSRREIEEERLLMLFGGSGESYTRWRDMLTAFGPEPRFIGGIGQAAALKLALNNLIAVHAAGFSLSLGIVERGGIDRDQFMEILRQSSLYAPMYDKKWRNWTAREFADPNFPTRHLQKDVRLIAEHAGEMGLNTRVPEAILAILDQAVAEGWGELDYSSLINVVHPVEE